MTSAILVATAFLIAFFVAMTIGASSVSVSMAPAVGANSVGVLRGAFLVGVFGFVGAVLQGQQVTSGVGSKIVDGPLTFEVAFVSLVAIGLFIALGILYEHSIPAAFSTFGSVAGAGVSAGYAPKLGYWSFVFASWVGTGVAAAVMGMGFLWAFTHLFDRVTISSDRLDAVILATGVVFSFVGGGSQVGLAIGPLVGVAEGNGVGALPLLAFGGVGILLGSWLKSPVMLNAVGRHYAALGPVVSLSVLATAIPLVQVVANVLGVPISYNHIIITTIIGCGLVNRSGMDIRKFGFTVASWVATLAGSFAVSFGLYALVDAV